MYGVHPWPDVVHITLTLTLDRWSWEDLEFGACDSFYLSADELQVKMHWLVGNLWNKDDHEGL